MRSSSLTMLFTLSLLFCNGLHAAPISGSVVDGSTKKGVPGVTIKALLSGKTWTPPEGTAADGSFSFELTEGFSPTELDTEFLNLEFNKPGFRKATRMRRARQRGLFIIGDLRVRLEALAADNDTPTDTIPVETENSPRRIFHGAYALFGDNVDAAGSSLENLNQRLPRHLRRGIITHLQQLQLPANIELDPVPADIEPSNSIKLRAFARSNDALAVILGEAEMIISDSGEAIELASEYRIIPLLPGFQPGTLYVDDRIPKADFRPSRLSRSLSKTWGATTVFALALYETRAAMEESDPGKKRQRLNSAESYLKAQKGSLTTHDILNQQIDGLLALIEQERKS